MHRFFLSADALLQDEPSLTGDEAHHCIGVLRHTPGDKVVVFDGRGNEATAVITEADKQVARLRITQRQRSAPLRCRLTLGQAIPKGKNMDLIIQKAVELGAFRISPILSERTVVQLDPDEAADKRQKWQAIALEACKQCGQNWLPEVDAPVTPRQFFASAPDAELMLVASLQSDARPLKSVLADHHEQHAVLPSSLTILIGPEGDFTPAELSLAKSHGCRPITLGPIILRTETAAIYCLSVLGHELFS
jgi:16S rRNA (uracil1498-N3)-methyltransferase